MPPNTLHQLHKGVVKAHLVPWISTIISPTELDTCFRSMSKFRGLWHFKDRITTMLQWTGKELKDMQPVFLGVIAGLVSLVSDVRPCQDPNINIHFVMSLQATICCTTQHILLSTCRFSMMFTIPDNLLICGTSNLFHLWTMEILSTQNGS